MENPILNLELDVMQRADLRQALDFTIKHSLRSVVVHQNLATTADLIRMSINGKFKIFTPIDWPKGELNGISKFRGVPHSTLSSDGFEICVNSNDTEQDLRDIADFVGSISRELRFVVGVYSKSQQEVDEIVAKLVSVSPSSMIRTDTVLKVQQSKGNIEANTNIANTMKNAGVKSIKLSGNFTTMKNLLGCCWANAVGVSLFQANSIIGDINKQPQGLLEVLS